MTPPVALVTLIGAVTLSATGAPPQAGGRSNAPQAPEPVIMRAPASVTVPFALDHNRMTIEIELVRSDGTTRSAQAWVDLGSEHLVIGEPLARDLRLDPAVLERAQGKDVASAPPSPPLRVAGLALDVTGIRMLVLPGASWRPGVVADLLLPASALRHNRVVLDYPARQMTVAQSGSLQPRGVGVPCRFNGDTGLLQVDATVDGKPVVLGIDNGSAGTWVSTNLTDGWRQRHPDWPLALGAAGSANFWGLSLEARGALMELPEIGLGPMAIHRVAVLGVAQGLFDWYSRKSAGPVVGFIGANVLRRYRLEIDYPSRMTYWEGGAASGPRDLDIVGLTIRAEPDGGYAVAGVVSRDGAPVVPGAEAGDFLLRIGSLDTAGAAMGAVIDALRGRPGEVRTLLLRRGGELLTIEAKVSHLP